MRSSFRFPDGADIDAGRVAIACCVQSTRLMPHPHRPTTRRETVEFRRGGGSSGDNSFQQLPTSADNVTLLAFAAAAPSGHRCRSISPARRAHSSKPAAAACSGRYMKQTDGQTDGRADTVSLHRPCRIRREQ